MKQTNDISFECKELRSRRVDAPPRRRIPLPQFSLAAFLCTIMLGMCLVMVGKYLSWSALIALLVPTGIVLIAAAVSE